MIEEFNLAIVQKYVAAGRSGCPIPMTWQQVGPMISPVHFRKYITQAYRRLMRPALEAGCVVHMHSRRDIRLLGG